MMQGFTDTANPVHLYLKEGGALGSGPFDIDGAQASLNGDGILADVGGTRYWVPTHMIDHIEQAQQAPIVYPDSPAPPAPPAPPSAG